MWCNVMNNSELHPASIVNRPYKDGGSWYPPNRLHGVRMKINVLFGILVRGYGIVVHNVTDCNIEV
jgi:hypothetical protein